MLLVSEGYTLLCSIMLLAFPGIAEQLHSVVSGISQLGANLTGIRLWELAQRPAGASSDPNGQTCRDVQQQCNTEHAIVTV